MAQDIIKQIHKYQILEELGKGAKSTIWKARDPDTGNIYALKHIVKETEEDEKFFEQAQIEYEISRKVSHEYLRKAYDLIKIRKWLKTQELILLLEYVEGKSLKQHRPTDINEIIDIFIKVAEGLDAMHQEGYLHTDIKPKNILVVPENGIKIIDFGQSCVIGHKKKRIQGTPDFMAPEQVRREVLDQRTDVFNLGASLYWVLTNRAFPTIMPKSGDLNEVVVPYSLNEIPRPDQINPEVPSALSKLVMDCCSYEIKARPQDMKEVIARLEVAKHLYNKAKGPESREAKTKKTEPPEDKYPQESEDIVDADSEDDDFDRFLESIL